MWKIPSPVIKQREGVHLFYFINVSKKKAAVSLIYAPANYKVAKSRVPVKHKFLS